MGAKSIEFSSEVAVRVCIDYLVKDEAEESVALGMERSLQSHDIHDSGMASS